MFYERETLLRLTAVVRSVAPEIVLTHAPSDYMEDHMNTSRLAVTAAFCRGMPNFPVKPATPVTDQSVTVYHAQPYSNRDPLGETVLPDLFVDVTDRLEDKVAMLSRHASQKRWLDESQGLDSYLQTLRDLDREVGEMSKVFEYAEGWRRHLHLGFCGPETDPLAEALSTRIRFPQRLVGQSNAHFTLREGVLELPAWRRPSGMPARQTPGPVPRRLARGRLAPQFLGPLDLGARKPLASREWRCRQFGHRRALEKAGCVAVSVVIGVTCSVGIVGLGLFANIARRLSV